MATPATSGVKSYWVVVADEAQAIFYSRETRTGPMLEMQRMRNDEARMKTSDILSDRGGRAFDSHGQGRHTMGGEKTDPHQHAAEIFAQRIAEQVSAGLHAGQCRAYALVASPRFLGALRSALSVKTREEAYTTLAKRVVDKDAETIASMLDAR